MVVGTATKMVAIPPCRIAGGHPLGRTVPIPVPIQSGARQPINTMMSQVAQVVDRKSVV